jgi:hypothetical protein
MPLTKSSGNMYEGIYTKNFVKGRCPHECFNQYCYMYRWNKDSPLRLDEKEFKEDLGRDKTIFIGSSVDMFAQAVPDEWIKRTLEYCSQFNNRYWYQTKNPQRYEGFFFPTDSVLGTTIETNEDNGYSGGQNMLARAVSLGKIGRKYSLKTFLTIEPIMRFKLGELAWMVSEINPLWVNIGADSGHNHLPEPSKDEVLALIRELNKITEVRIKKNLARIIGGEFI